MLACVIRNELDNKQNRCAVCVEFTTCSQSGQQLADVHRALLAKFLQDFRSTKDCSIDFGVNLSVQQSSRCNMWACSTLLLQSVHALP